MNRTTGIFTAALFTMTISTAFAAGQSTGAAVNADVASPTPITSPNAAGQTGTGTSTTGSGSSSVGTGVNVNGNTGTGVISNPGTGASGTVKGSGSTGNELAQEVAQSTVAVPLVLELAQAPDNNYLINKGASAPFLFKET